MILNIVIISLVEVLYWARRTLLLAKPFP
uniref:Uncharacterized protein n=1 Tax=Rhizophora mucronata TaxID=61149 RepID=A0A2P2PA49_RHIMU